MAKDKLLAAAIETADAIETMTDKMIIAADAGADVVEVGVELRVLEESNLRLEITLLRDQVDLLTENMMKLQQALLLTNQKLAEFERRQSPIIGIGGEPIRRQ
jgi:hypothetical protein